MNILEEHWTYTVLFHFYGAHVLMNATPTAFDFIWFPVELLFLSEMFFFLLLDSLNFESMGGEFCY